MDRTPVSDAALLSLAEAAGFLVEWKDASGELRKVSVGTARAALDALGFPAATGAQIAESRRRLEHTGVAPRPMRIVRDGRPPGYYPAPDGKGVVAVPPSRCFSVRDATGGRRAAGLAAQLYSLRGGHTAGFGDLAALAELAREAGAHNIDAIAVSPIHAPFAAVPEIASPYSPSSRYFLNPLYADISLASAD